MKEIVRIWDYEVSALIRVHNFDYYRCVDAFKRLGLTFEEEPQRGRVSVLTANEGWANFAIG